MGRFKMTGTELSMTSSIIRIGYTLSQNPRWEKRSFRQHMTLHYQGIRVSWRPTGRPERGSHGRASREKLCSMYGNVASVSKTRLRTSMQQGYFSHYRFQNRSGKASPWTLLQDCPRSRLFICSSWQTDQVCTFLLDTIRLLGSCSGVIFQESFQVTRVAQDHCQWSG